MDEPLESDNWPVMGPSMLPYPPKNQIPREMTLADMAQVKAEFVTAVKLAIECNFDMLELHAAHGYLLSSFITPLSNSAHGRIRRIARESMRYPLECSRDAGSLAGRAGRCRFAFLQQIGWTAA